MRTGSHSLSSQTQNKAGSVKTIISNGSNVWPTTMALYYIPTL